MSQPLENLEKNNCIDAPSFMEIHCNWDRQLKKMKKPKTILAFFVAGPKDGEIEEVNINSNGSPVLEIVVPTHLDDFARPKEDQIKYTPIEMFVYRAMEFSSENCDIGVIYAPVGWDSTRVVAHLIMNYNSVKEEK